jgi:hypothetical protein
MSATMARQGGRVQLEQSDMCLALNMGTMAKEGFSRASIEDTKYLIKKPCAKVREEMMRGVEFPGHTKVKTAIQRHPAMLRHNQTSGCLPCQNGTAKNLQTRCRRKGTGAPPPAPRRVRTPEQTLPPPGMPPAPTSNTTGDQLSENVNLLAGYTYSHTALPCAEFFEHNGDTKHDTDFDPDMMTDDG